MIRQKKAYKINREAKKPNEELLDKQCKSIEKFIKTNILDQAYWMIKIFFG